ncbi:MAG: response regulator [Candidatus Omnitrophica bacterium]|nr:response regulator [Candidatus Omnitrophota bacterium]
MSRQRVVIADDDADIRDIIRITLEAEGFEVLEAPDGAVALNLIHEKHPHVVVLDSRMPRMEGEEVCRILKQNVLLRHVPVLLVTAKGDVADKVKGLSAGADDYIVKPFEPAELVARVRMILRRTSEALDANPLTKLPGNVSIMEEFERRIARRTPMAVCYVDLDQFKAFNDAYGFERGDKVIRRAGQILLEAMRRLGNIGDFLGHVGGDDFVLVTTPDRVDAIAQEIVNEMKRQLAELYDPKARSQGYIEGKDRTGKLARFNLLSASVAVVTNTKRDISHVAEIGQIGAELKSWAKSHGGGIVVKDRRGEESPPTA